MNNEVIEKLNLCINNRFSSISKTKKDKIITLALKCQNIEEFTLIEPVFYNPHLLDQENFDFLMNDILATKNRAVAVNKSYLFFSGLDCPYNLQNIFKLFNDVDNQIQAKAILEYILCDYEEYREDLFSHKNIQVIKLLSEINNYYQAMIINYMLDLNMSFNLIKKVIVFDEVKAKVMLSILQSDAEIDENDLDLYMTSILIKGLSFDYLTIEPLINNLTFKKIMANAKNLHKAEIYYLNLIINNKRIVTSDNLSNYLLLTYFVKNVKQAQDLYQTIVKKYPRPKPYPHNNVIIKKLK